MSEQHKLYMGRPRADFVTKLITRDEWKLVCKIREAEICSRKEGFDTKDSALREIIRRMNRIENPAPPLSPYECHCCGKWHLSSRTKPFKDPAADQ